MTLPAMYSMNWKIGGKTLRSSRFFAVMIVVRPD